MIHTNSVLRIAISEEAAARELGLATSIWRAAAVVGVTDRIQILKGTDVQGVHDLDLIVHGQQTPAQLSSAIFADWRRRFPLARQVIVWGPWCEGGMRNGYWEPGSVCISQLVWPWRFQCFLRQYFHGWPTLWDLPATKTNADRLGASAIVAKHGIDFQPQPDETFSMRVELVPSPAGVGAALPQLCESLGWTYRPWPDVSELLRIPPPERGPIWIWEPEVPGAEFDVIVSTRERLAGRGVILLGFAEILSYVRCHSTVAPLHSALSEHGRTILLPKPFLVAELQAAVCDLSFEDGRGANRF